MILESLLETLIIVTIGLIFLCPISINKGERDVLNKSNTERMKGLACLMVVIGHATYQLKGSLVFSLTWNLGFLAVGIFFFISGYGLMTNLIKKEDYLKNFIKKRVIKLLVPFWLSNIVFLFYNILMGKHYNTIETLEYLSGCRLLVGHNWYIQSIAIFYIIFFVMAILIKKKTTLIFVMSIVYISIIIASQVIKIPFLPAYIFTGITFVIGMIFAYNNKLVSIIINSKLIYKILLTTLLILMYLYTTIWIYHGVNQLVLTKICNCLCPVLFVITMLIIVNIIKFGNKVFHLLAICSYEVYLLHQLAINIIVKINVSSSILLIIIVLLAFFFGYILHRVDEMIQTLRVK